MEKERLDRSFFGPGTVATLWDWPASCPTSRDWAVRLFGSRQFSRTGTIPTISSLDCRQEECCHGWISDSCWHFLKIFGVLRYAMLDFTLLDKRLGTLQELRDLINAAHNLGMYVIVDVLISEQQCDWQAFWWSWGVGKFCLILILIDHFCQVVMNHMGNEFYFSGYQSGQAPWRFHEEDGLREYELKFRKEPGRILTVSFGKIGGASGGFWLGIVNIL